MSDEILQRQIHDLVNGTLSEAGLRELQERLKSDSTARAQFRERIDLEASLRTWATEGLTEREPAVSHAMSIDRTERFWSPWKIIAVLASAASILVIAALWTQGIDPASPGEAGLQRQTQPRETAHSAALLGSLIESEDCVWHQPPLLRDGKFQAGTIALASGAAELRFDSATNVTLEGPCELLIESADTAKLLSGTVYVDVTEVSNGFLLETPEARIIDEGTQYAVLLDDKSTEVHVFDGSVIWTSTRSDADFEERIDSGEARRYRRSEPGRSQHVPFGQRQFVRRIEERVRQAAGGDLIAYDGFENLAGQLRRGRSGFGWDGGWESAGRGRGPLAEVMDAPKDEVFGIERTGRRLLLLQNNDRLRRKLAAPIQVEEENPVFVGLLVSRMPSDDSGNALLQIALEPESDSLRYVRRHSIVFGLNANGYLFINNSGTVRQTATLLKPGETCFVAFRYSSSDGSGRASLRVYSQDQMIDRLEPNVWTVECNGAEVPAAISAIRFTSVGGTWQIDELKIGRSWDTLIDTTRD